MSPDLNPTSVSIMLGNGHHMHKVQGYLFTRIHVDNPTMFVVAHRLLNSINSSADLYCNKNQTISIKDC